MSRDRARRRLASVALFVLGFASAAVAQDATSGKSGEVRINGFADWRYASTAIGSAEFVGRPIELLGELIHQHAEDDLAEAIATGTLHPKTNLVQFAAQFTF